MLYYLVFICIFAYSTLNGSQICEAIPAITIRLKKTVDNRLNGAMWEALSFNYMTVLEQLFAGDPIPNVNAPHTFGQTPLMRAMYLDRPAMFRFLIQHGANIHAATTPGQTALWYAIAMGNRDMAQYLINHGADLTTRDQNNTTLLMTAIGSLNPDLFIVKLLIDLGADVNARDKNGETPLHYAAKNGRSEIVKLLIAAGADTEIKNKRGRTAFDFKKAEQVSIQRARAEGEKLREASLKETKMEIAEQEELIPELAGVISEYVHGAQPKKRKCETDEEKPPKKQK